MRSTRALFTALAVQVLVLGACATPHGTLEQKARKNYAAGSYDQAVMSAAQAIRLKPDYTKAWQVLASAVPAAVKSHQAKIDELQASGAQFRADGLVREFEALAGLSQTIQTLPPPPPGVDAPTMPTVARELGQVRQQAAEAHYVQGERLARRPDVDSRKAAVKEFRTAQQFLAGYRDAVARAEALHGSAVKRVAVLPFEDRSGRSATFGDLSQVLLDDVISQIMNDPSATEFLQIVPRDQISQVMQEQKFGASAFVDERSVVGFGKLLGAHEIVVGQLTQIVLTPERTTRRDENRRGQVVTGYRDTTDSKGKKKKEPIFGEVTASVALFTRSAAAQLVGSYKIIDVETGTLKKADAFRGESAFNATWATSSGDERALRSSDTRLIKTGEQRGPGDEALVSQALRDLAQRLSAALKSYVR